MLLDTNYHNVALMSEKKNRINNDGLREKLDDASHMKK